MTTMTLNSVLQTINSEAPELSVKDSQGLGRNLQGHSTSIFFDKAGYLHVSTCKTPSVSDQIRGAASRRYKGSSWEKATAQFIAWARIHKAAAEYADREVNRIAREQKLVTASVTPLLSDLSVTIEPLYNDTGVTIRGEFRSVEIKHQENFGWSVGNSGRSFASALPLATVITLARITLNAARRTA